MSQKKTTKAKLDNLLKGWDAPARQTRTRPAKTEAAAAPIEPTERRGPGRPPGKRTNPDYQSVTTFLHKQTYLDVQRALVGAGQDFGDVVDDLLKEWLARQA